MPRHLEYMFAADMEGAWLVFGGLASQPNRFYLSVFRYGRFDSGFGFRGAILQKLGPLSFGWAGWLSVRDNQGDLPHQIHAAWESGVEASR